MKEIFDRYIEVSFDGLAQAKFKFLQFELNYKEHFPTSHDAKVLDIGIGRGEMLTCMKEWGFVPHGVDISPSAVNFCSSIGLPCELTDDTIAWLHRVSGEFQLITCLDVLEHVPREDTIAFLRALRGALSADGKAIIQVPNLQSPFGYLHHFNDFTHVSGFVEHSLEQVLLAADFSVFRIQGFEEIYKKTFRSKVHRVLRWAYRRLVRFLRAVNVNPNPTILDPVMFVVALK